ncbi:MAG: N-acetylmuramoyl-L-alanine amidase [Corynebacterium sp.]|nr:N-acetylmuramoyl-L-alanine amidase [Corynebacterium sp.]
MNHPHRTTAIRAHLRPSLILILSVALIMSYVVAAKNTKFLDDLKPVSASVDTHPLSEASRVEIPADQSPAAQSTGATGEDWTAHKVAEAPTAVFQASSAESFSMFALTWSDPENTNPQVELNVRSQRADGSWTPWYDTHTLPQTADKAVKGTDVVYVQPTTTIQISFSQDSASIEELGAPQMVFIDGKKQNTIAPMAYTANEQLRLIPRASWGADESIRCEGPTYNDRVTGITIHHTVGSNDYAVNDAPGIVRGIYTYHAKTLGWCDIGYHSLVDRFGNIYEGAYGGFDRAVEGAHAGGFNQNTWAISMMGTFTQVAPSNDMLSAVGNLAGWKAFISGFDPLGSTVHYSEGSSYTPYPRGTAVTLRNIFAHRDVDNTECPGDAAYAQMDNIRGIASQRYAAMRTGAATAALQFVAGPSAPSNDLVGQIGPFLAGGALLLLILFLLGVFGSTSGNDSNSDT